MAYATSTENVLLSIYAEALFVAANMALVYGILHSPLAEENKVYSLAFGHSIGVLMTTIAILVGLTLPSNILASLTKPTFVVGSFLEMLGILFQQNLLKLLAGQLTLISLVAGISSSFSAQAEGFWWSLAFILFMYSMSSFVLVTFLQF